MEIDFGNKQEYLFKSLFMQGNKKANSGVSIKFIHSSIHFFTFHWDAILALLGVVIAASTQNQIQFA